MKKILVFGVWILITIINSCTGNKNTSESLEKNYVKIIGYGLFHEIEWQTETQVLINDSTDFIEYLYPADLAKPDSFSIHVVKRIILNDSILVYYDDTTRLISSKTYTIDGEETEVRKYFSDAGKLADGEYHIYWNDDVGLISLQNQAWGNFEMFYYENEKLSQVLKADTLGLFDRLGD
ncbi:hypothetical protein [Algoriphagus persicinus]|uniref:hypothetical protein n=1 Tax=Algoriphagus persicinus TaxID=3108754 RepID=UPI002B3E39A9|nr:hypothetical protein [Algoriphagus sp. E1-3-M2]MEB2786933.1 hypothetical protein [Algoriphagus sp. E1-3-M2]